jgi:hypothetical protein
METEEKVEFYVNQKVFDYIFKFGTVVQINQTPNSEKYLVVNFERLKNSVYYDLTGRLIILEHRYVHTRAVNPTLATKEYNLDENFTQELQIDYTKYIDKWGKFGNSKDKIEFIGVLKDFRETSEGLKYFYPFEDKNIDYEYFEPLSDDEFENLKNIITVYYEDNEI